MRILLAIPIPTVAAIAGGLDQRKPVAPDRLVDLRTFLLSAKRAEAALTGGEKREGTIEAVSAKEIALNVRAAGGLRQIETIPTERVRSLRLFHTAPSNWKRKVGRTLGFAGGLALAGPATFRLAEAGSWRGAWAAFVTLPALGAMAGERLARQSQERWYPCYPTPIPPLPAPYRIDYFISGLFTVAGSAEKFCRITNVWSLKNVRVPVLLNATGFAFTE